MPEAQPKCINIDCQQLLTVEEKDWEKDSPAYHMLERVCTKKCEECGTEQRVEKFTEVSYMCYAMPPVEPEEGEEGEEAAPQEAETESKTE